MTEPAAQTWLTQNGYSWQWCGVLVHVSKGGESWAYRSCWEAWAEMTETINK